MLAFIEGTVCEKALDHMILECYGIGYHVKFDPQAASQMPALGAKARVWTYLHVREDDLSLYAFPSFEEKQLFELLLTVSGFGPKLAGAVAAQISPDSFALAVVNADVQLLCSVKGVGKKSAERLILELKDKLKAAGFNRDAEATESGGVSSDGDSQEGDALAALQVLGYSRREAAAAIAKVLAAAAEKLELKDLLRLALAEMSIRA